MTELRYNLLLGDWTIIPQEVFVEFQKNLVNLSGCDILFIGDIPQGAGLSSSVSLEVVTAVSINRQLDLAYSLVEQTKLAQRAENVFVGINCGIMDQFTSGLGKAGHAVLQKCDTLAYQYVPLLLGDYRLVITNSRKRRSLRKSKYNQRRLECEAGIKILRSELPEFTSLGNVTPEQWRSVRHKIVIS